MFQSYYGILTESQMTHVVLIDKDNIPLAIITREYLKSKLSGKFDMRSMQPLY